MDLLLQPPLRLGQGDGRARAVQRAAGADSARPARARPITASCFPGASSCSKARAASALGDILAAVLEAEGERPKQVEEERGRFLRAPLVIGVISAAREQIKIPVWEQELSAGAVCQNILIAAHALGFVGNWLTEWYAYHPAVKERLGLKPGERVAGFIYIGTPSDRTGRTAPAGDGQDRQLFLTFRSTAMKKP